jgi:hypothetical protein
LRPPIFLALRALLQRSRGLIWVTLAALAVRLVWNLKFHNPVNFAYSDMGGYLDRANTILDDKWKAPPLPPHPHVADVFDYVFSRLIGAKAPYLTLYPHGTHVFLYVVKRLFGRANATAIGASFAVLGTVAVSYTYATAARFSQSAAVRRVVAFILIFYYPWISLGGYALSETPFTTCVAATAFHGLRLADRGRKVDAWMLGLWIGLGAIVRPQMLVAAVFLGVLFLVRRRVWRGFTPGLVWRAAAPLAILLGLSAGRLYYHVNHDHLGLISQNGPLNFVFGRCHNTGLNAKAKDGSGFFGPPALGSLLAWEKAHPNPIFSLDPAMGVTLTFSGHMWDAEPTYKLARECVQKTGPWRQVKYAVTHVILLWGYNSIWPDMGQKKYQLAMDVACALHSAVILPPAALALLLAFRKRRARSMLLALHVWSLVLTSMLYFGDTRYRAPYDGILVVLAVVMYGEIFAAVRRGWRALRERRHQRARRALVTLPLGGAAPVGSS